MSGLLSMRRAAAPRHAAPRGPSRAPQQASESSVALIEADLSIVPDDLSIVRDNPSIAQPVVRPFVGPARRPRVRQSSRRQLDFQRRLQLSRAGLLARNVGLVIGAVIVLFGAVLLLLVAASWAGDRQHGPESGSSTVY